MSQAFVAVEPTKGVGVSGRQSRKEGAAIEAARGSTAVD